MTFLITVSHGKSAYCWKTMPRSGLGPLTGLPSTSTLAVGGGLEAADDVQKRGFAAAGRTDDRDELVLVDIEVDAVQSRHLTPLRVWNFFTTWSTWTFTAEPFPAIR